MSETSSMQPGATTTAGDSTRLTSEMDQLKADFTRLKDDFRKIVDDGMSVARAGGDTAKESIAGQLSSVQDRGQEVVKSVEEMIQERPLTSLAIAVGAGFLLGKLLD